MSSCNYNSNHCKDRIFHRNYMTGMLTHLTKPKLEINTKTMNDKEINIEAVKNLIKILNNKFLK